MWIALIDLQTLRIFAFQNYRSTDQILLSRNTSRNRNFSISPQIFSSLHLVYIDLGIFHNNLGLISKLGGDLWPCYSFLINSALISIVLHRINVGTHARKITFRSIDRDSNFLSLPLLFFSFHLFSPTVRIPTEISYLCGN